MPSSYANPGCIGDRRSIITVSSDLTVNNTIDQLVDGAFGPNFFWNIQAVTGKQVKFDFGPVILPVVVEAKFYTSGNNAHGDWKWQGSSDDSVYTDIGSSFTLVTINGSTPQVITTLSGNTTSYRYYRLLGVTGNTSDVPYIYEFEFKTVNMPRTLGNALRPRIFAPGLAR
jgi:hypothetical protein